ncbi:MAG: phosphotransferase, partial [Candidatus Nanoarchaeia archaeon]|nr:phosphotransferase [Candidatus Nanoarchaeia archaeon]
DYNELSKKLSSIDYSKLRKGIIHGDLTEVNILQHNNKFSGFIDFAYSYKYYLVMDLGHYIANCIIKPEWIKDFFKEYKKIMKLKAEEKKALYYFIKINLLRKDHLTRDSYPIFNKLSLKDFMKLY